MTVWTEFTSRAVCGGLLIGVLLCFVNMHLGLQSGWISMMSLQASLVGFGLFKVLPRMPAFSEDPLTVHENIVLQTVAVATGTLPLAAGLVGVVPALALLGPADHQEPLTLSFGQLIAWCTAVAFFGVFLAVPLRKQVIVKEQLVFPSGTATAQIIGVLHELPSTSAKNGARRRARRASADGTHYEALNTNDVTYDSEEREHDVKVGRESWNALLQSFSISAIYTLFSQAFPVLYTVPIFDIFGPLAHDWQWWFTPSFSYVGQGIIMGWDTVVSMNLGMLCGWAFLAPLAHRMGWAPGSIGAPDGAKAWILWPALAIMISESILSLSFVTCSTLFKRSAPLIADAEELDIDADSDDDDGVASAARKQEPEVGMQTVLAGLGVSCALCVLLIARVFGDEGIKWWATIIAIALACLFSILGVRALGETDLNPVSAIGKISQLIFALIQPHNIIANLLAGGISEAGAQQAGDLMQDLKTGYLHGASSRAQFYGQLIGSAASVFVSTGIYVLYRRVYELPSTQFPVPTAGIWLNLARLVNSGELPPRTKEAMILFGGLFVVLASVKTIGAAKARQQEDEGGFFEVEDESTRNAARRMWPWWTWTRRIPSGIAFAIGFINQPAFSLARLVGGYISYRYATRFSRTQASHLDNLTLIVVASGFVLGEGAASVVGLLAKSAGLGPISCAGCHSYGGGYCSSC